MEKFMQIMFLLARSMEWMGVERLGKRITCSDRCSALLPRHLAIALPPSLLEQRTNLNKLKLI